MALHHDHSISKGTILQLLVPPESSIIDSALSFVDASFWCYACDSYIFSEKLRGISTAFGNLKHLPRAEVEIGKVKG
jgi:hypothetical protein